MKFKACYPFYLKSPDSTCCINAWCSKQIWINLIPVKRCQWSTEIWVFILSSKMWGINFSLWAFTQGHNWLAVKINRNRSLYHTPTGFGLKPPPIWRCYECFTPRAWLNLTRNTCMKMPWRGRGLGIGIKEFSSDSNLASYMLRIVGTTYFISEIIALHYWGDIPGVHQSHSLSIPSSSRLMLQQDQDTHLSVED